MSMSKNVIIGIAVVVLVVVVGVFFILGRGGEVIDVAVFIPDETELNSMAADIEAFSQDEIILNEVEDTFGDITDARDAFSIDTIDQEAAEVDLSATLDAFDEDENILNELDQVFGEVSQ